MKQIDSPLMELMPPGFPYAICLSGSVVLGCFIPAMDGEIVAKERPQARIITAPGKRPFPQFYTPKKTAAWEHHVAEIAKIQLLSVEADGDQDFILPVAEKRVMATMRFNLRKPPSYPKSVIHATKKPDLDNLVKAILDGLVSGRILEDDNCVTDLTVSKRYADAIHPPGVEIEMTCLPL